MQSYSKYHLSLAIITFSIILIGLNLYLDINALNMIDIIIDVMLIGAIVLFLFLNKKYNLLCRSGINCLYLEEESVKNIEELKKHLSEQRHDFLNVMQILYGYTQLKKPDKTINYIKSYSKKIENLGRLYNMKNIKFADMLYNMEREADFLGIDFNMLVETPDNNYNPVLDNDGILFIVEGLINNYFYAISSLKNSMISLCFKFSDNGHRAIIRLYVSGDLHNDEGFGFSKAELFWDSIQKNIPHIDTIKNMCNELRIDTCISEDLRDVELSFMR